MSLNGLHADAPQSKIQPISTMLEHVMLQVEYPCLADLHFKQIDPLYKELCLIIAEILLANPNSSIKVNGEYVCTRLIQDVFSKIRNHHVQLVFNNFCDVSTRVFNKKAYLRTALYNSVFEYEAHFVNDLTQG